jgi:hypothetical protein
LYIDGQLVGWLGNVTANVSNTASFKIGKWSFEDSFNGKIDDIRLFNYALSGTEIAALYSANFIGVVTDPAGDATPYPGVTSPDLISATGSVTGTNLVLNVQFAPGTFDPATCQVTINLDTDENISTGSPGVDSGCVNDASLMGTDFIVWMQPRSFQALVFKSSGGCNSWNMLGTIAVTLKGNGMETTVPMALLDNDDGKINFKALSNAWLGQGTNSTNVLDVMPDYTLPPGKIR